MSHYKRPKIEVTSIFIHESIASASVYTFTPIGANDDLYPEVDNWLEGDQQTDNLTL